MSDAVMSDLCHSILKCATRISEASKFSSGTTSQINSYGETVKKLDKVANDIFLEELEKCIHVAGVASEELDVPIFFTKNKNAKYVAVIDPLDGSSNIDYMITVGSIFGFYEIIGDKATDQDFLQPGNKLVLAGYTLYGPATTMVICDGKTVSEHFLRGENFFKHRENIKCPDKGKWLSANACNMSQWEQPIVDWFFNALNSDYSQRYVGSLVADFHRTLIDGGVFAYPADKNGKAKLRLLYECNPLAYIMQVAGGNSITGVDRKNILDIIPNTIHDKCGVFTGSKKDISF